MVFKGIKKSVWLAIGLVALCATPAFASDGSSEVPTTVTTLEVPPTGVTTTTPAPPTETVPTSTTPTTTDESPTATPSPSPEWSSSGSSGSGSSQTTSAPKTSPSSALDGPADYTVAVNRVKLLSNGTLNVSIRCTTSKLTVCSGRVRVSAGIGSIGSESFKVVSGRDVWINVDISKSGIEYLRDRSAPKVRVNVVSSVSATAASKGRSFKVRVKHLHKSRSSSTHRL